MCPMSHKMHRWDKHKRQICKWVRNFWSTNMHTKILALHHPRHKDITLAYLNKRRLRIWTDRNREQSITGETSWPSATCCLSEIN